MQPCGNVLRIYFLCLVEFFDRFVVLALVPERDAELGKDVGEGRREAEGLAVFINGLIKSPSCW